MSCTGSKSWDYLLRESDLAPVSQFVQDVIYRKIVVKLCSTVCVCVPGIGCIFSNWGHHRCEQYVTST